MTTQGALIIRENRWPGLICSVPRRSPDSKCFFVDSAPVATYTDHGPALYGNNFLGAGAGTQKSDEPPNQLVYFGKRRTVGDYRQRSLHGCSYRG